MSMNLRSNLSTARIFSPFFPRFLGIRDIINVVRAASLASELSLKQLTQQTLAALDELEAGDNTRQEWLAEQDSPLKPRIPGTRS